MTSSAAHRDERTLVVENTSYRWAFHVVTFGLLVAVAYRSFAKSDAAWDLLALVILGGAVASLHQWTHNVLTKRSAVAIAAAMALAAVMAAVMVAVIVWLR